MVKTKQEKEQAEIITYLTISTRVEVGCVNCSHHEQLEMPSDFSIQGYQLFDAAKELQTRGWKIVREKGDTVLCCPKCAGKV